MVSILCQERLGVKSYTHVVEPQTSISPADEALLAADMARLLAAEPLQYVLGFADFYGYRYNVSPAVLIPRPETELLVQEGVKAALGLPHPASILDLCTGSGCIAWTLLRELQDASVTAVDISEEALALARSQGGAPSPRFLRADILDPEQDMQGSFDILVSNPPYVMDGEKAQMRRNVLDYEPALALFVPDSDPLLFYRAFARWGRRVLLPGGQGLVEINEALGAETAALFAAEGFADVRIIPDLSGRSRIVAFRK